LKGILTGLSDIIFPPGCLTCDIILDHHEQLPVCPTCYSKIKFITSPLCTCCGIPFSGADTSDHLCGDCTISKPAYSVARALGHYDATLLGAIHNFKYRGKTASGKILGRLMAENDYPAVDFQEYTLTIPVPLHVRRLRERGFNQSVILAREIARKFHTPLDFLTLRRYIYTEPQINLGKRERESNVRGAFKIMNPEKIKDQRIILVDDVYTTGSTVKECARLLLKEGASSVAVLTLARAV
jgi:ComF family protein